MEFDPVFSRPLSDVCTEASGEEINLVVNLAQKLVFPFLCLEKCSVALVNLINKVCDRV